MKIDEFDWAAALSWLPFAHFQTNQFIHKFTNWFIFQCSYYSQLSIYCYNTFISFHFISLTINEIQSNKRNSFLLLEWMNDWLKRWKSWAALLLSANAAAVGYGLTAPALSLINLFIHSSSCLSLINQLTLLAAQSTRLLSLVKSKQSRWNESNGELLEWRPAAQRSLRLITHKYEIKKEPQWKEQPPSINSLASAGEELIGLAALHLPRSRCCLASRSINQNQFMIDSIHKSKIYSFHQLIQVGFVDFTPFPWATASLNCFHQFIFRCCSRCPLIQFN